MSFHGMALGETGSGKTYKMRELATIFRNGGVGVLAYIPEGHRWPMANYASHHAARFIAKVNRSRRCAVFVEMSDAEVAKNNDDFTRLATWSRNLGHRCFFIAQRHTQINPTIRDQCGFLWLFRVGYKTAETLAEEYVDPLLKRAPTLFDYHFILKKRGRPASINAPALLLANDAPALPPPASRLALTSAQCVTNNV